MADLRTAWLLHISGGWVALGRMCAELAYNTINAAPHDSQYMVVPNFGDAMKGEPVYADDDLVDDSKHAEDGPADDSKHADVAVDKASDEVEVGDNVNLMEQ